MADAAHIKTEAEAEASPGRVGTPDEEDLYEDAGDLEFYDRNAGPNTENIYLARVPGYVWEAWVKMTEKLGDHDEVQIGTLRNWNEVKPNGLVEVRRIPCAPFGWWDFHPYGTRHAHVCTDFWPLHYSPSYACC